MLFPDLTITDEEKVEVMQKVLNDELARTIEKVQDTEQYQQMLKQGTEEKSKKMAERDGTLHVHVPSEIMKKINALSPAEVYRHDDPSFINLCERCGSKTALTNRPQIDGTTKYMCDSCWEMMKEHDRLFFSKNDPLVKDSEIVDRRVFSCVDCGKHIPADKAYGSEISPRCEDCYHTRGGEVIGKRSTTRYKCVDPCDPDHTCQHDCVDILLVKPTEPMPSSAMAKWPNTPLNKRKKPQ
jgi:hypothetical protein